MGSVWQSYKNQPGSSVFQLINWVLFFHQGMSTQYSSHVSDISLAKIIKRLFPTYFRCLFFAPCPISMTVLSVKRIICGKTQFRWCQLQRGARQRARVFDTQRWKSLSLKVGLLIPKGVGLCHRHTQWSYRHWHREHHDPLLDDLETLRGLDPRPHANASGIKAEGENGKSILVINS